MMTIHNNFTGGNIKVEGINGDSVTLTNELRDTTEPWFYWAFCIEGAQNRTITFNLEQNRLGYFGPAVSHDLVTWKWLDSVDGDSFTYTFGENEDKVYFAHNMLYHPAHFNEFAKKHKLLIEELCTGYKGSSVPCVRFGEGSTSMVLTARHHACESTGNYVLQGVIEELLEDPIPDMKVFCVPFVDYEGVIRGDQGKRRAPHDHNRDYETEEKSHYPECRAIKEYIKENGCHYAFDFHSPWHMRNQNDHEFIVQNSIVKLEKQKRFGKLFEEAITSKSFIYKTQNDYPPETGWNHTGPQFSVYAAKKDENRLAFSLETPYFGTFDNKGSCEKLIELGHCFARALKKYIETEYI